MPLATELLTVEACALIVIDAQPGFIHRLPPAQQGRLLQRLTWLIGVAAWLGVPILATAEDSAVEGTLAPEVAAALPAGTPVFEKGVFNLAAEPAILAAVAATGRRTQVLAGLETDVCVAHSALGLLAAGYEVAAAADALGAPGAGHQAGLARLRGAGVPLLNVKGLYYEWVRTVARANQLAQERPHLHAQLAALA